ncbi:hypothetical protein L1987_71958 [Smallanthus sonchifolius]|uniref:Uncharacterized protein n=1 Tax=Smallanthus sonchifolius TaxID=185202 RepID=A0ACB9AV78_9ASTR|nr:hypothetical protein L1987_71958 [Smallanthus sonchifolius]
MILLPTSAAVANVFKSFHFSGSGKARKPNLLPRDLSRKLSKHGFWKRTIDQKKEENILPPPSKLSAAVTTATAEVKTSTSNSNSTSMSASADSYFTVTSDSSTTGGSSEIDEAQNDVEQSDKLATEKMNPVNGDNAAVTTSSGANGNGNAKEKLSSEEKDHFSPISVMDFPCDNDIDDEDEVTSPFHDIYLYFEGSERKVMPKAQRTKTLKPVRLEDRITLSESKIHNSILETSLQSEWELQENQTRKKAIALLQLFKATMPPRGLSKSKMMESVLLEFFTERVIEENVSNYTILQDAKDWVNGLTREMFDSNNYKPTYVKDMEKGVKWLTYDGEVEKVEVVSIIEYEVFTSLVEEMFLDLYL